MIASRPGLRKLLAGKRGRALSAITLSALALTVAIPATQAHALNAAQKKNYVLQAPVDDLKAIGQHLMFGYHALWQLEPLFARGALGGVFVTDHNAKAARTIAGLKTQISKLRAKSAPILPRPLWVAVDQEGGLVSRLSPPLPRPASLQNLIGSPVVKSADQRTPTVKGFAQTKAESLADLGVSINFAPVIDLRPARALKRDRYTLLRRRAIAANPDTVADVATTYCKAHLANGVLCTLKHFPGLTAVGADTHLTGAKLASKSEDLAKNDWRPYRDVLGQTQTAVMVGHPIFTDVDAKHPASTSKPVISGILRDQWAFEGLVITDDLYMGAIRKRRGGMGKAAVDALNAGADIILISRDGSELYPVIYDVLRAYQTGKLDKSTLLKSRARLDAAAALIANNRAVDFETATSRIPPPQANPRRISAAPPQSTAPVVR